MMGSSTCGLGTWDFNQVQTFHVLHEQIYLFQTIESKMNLTCQLAKNLRGGGHIVMRTTTSYFFRGSKFFLYTGSYALYAISKLPIIDAKADGYIVNEKLWTLIVQSKPSVIFF